MPTSSDVQQYGATDCAPCLDEKETAKGSYSSSHIYILVAILCTASVAEGYDLGVINGAIVQIQDEFQFDSHQVGMIVAILPFFCFVGALLHGSMADRFGRRLSLVSAVAFLFIGPLVMATASSITLLMVGRGLAGIGVGGGMLVVTMYVAELAPKSQRGRLVACQEVALNFGMVLGFFIGWFLLGVHNDWRWMLGLGSLLHLPLIVVLLAVYFNGASDIGFLPETSRWLARQGRFVEAYQVLEKYDGALDTSRQLSEIQEDCRKEAEEEEFISWGEILCAWRKRPMFVMLLTGILVAVAEMVCGGTSIAVYSNMIMKDHLGKSAAFFATVIMGVVRLTGIVIAFLTIDFAGRRPLLLGSASVMAMACIWIGAIVHFRFAINYMLPVGICVMMFGFVMGLGFVSLVYISEIFPTRVRQKGMVICMFWCRFGGAACAMAYPTLIDNYGISVTFFLQGAVNLTLLGFLWLMVVETKGLSLERAYKLFDKS